MKLRINLILLCLLALFSMGAYAQQQGGPPPMDTTPPPTAEQMKAAEDVLSALHMEQTIGTNFNNMITRLGATMPAEQQKTFSVAMQKFVTKYCTWDIMRPLLCKIYAQNFSADELKQLAAFYRTPLGVKVAAKLPELSAQSVQMGQRLVLDHQAELEQMIKDAQKQ